LRPLAGITVIDAGAYVSAPFAALQLADLGAEVIKVEAPAGDPGRKFGTRYRGTSYLFAANSRNKRGVVCDLKTADGLQAFEDLLARSDVLITNWRPGVAEGFGLTADTVADRYPALVWVRVSGYGQDGPRADFAAFDSVLQAKGGGMSGAGRDPVFARGYTADKVTGTFAAQSALAALHARHATGRGSVVDVSMLDAMAYWNSPDLLSGHAVLDAVEPRVLQLLDAARPVCTKDGWMVVAAVSGDQIKRALTAVEHPEWLERLKAAPSPAEMAETLYGLLDTVLPDRTSGEWEDAFRAADVPAASVLEPEAHFEDAQVAHNATYHVIDDPLFGPMRVVRHPALFDGTPAETDDLPVPPLTP
jgi:crotonobetainyl-CoA:carnitine CoA-transferase CaiB-like acyl-CoA transferase